MTTTALRALTVAALSAAITLTTLAAPAQAEGCGFADDSVPGGWVATDCYGSAPDTTGDEQAQLDEERIGGYRCPDPAQVILSVNPDVCGLPVGTVDTSAAPVPSAPSAASAQPARTAPESPGAIQEPLADGYVAVGTAADTAATAALPGWVLQDKLMEWLKALLPWIFGL